MHRISLITALLLLVWIRSVPAAGVVPSVFVQNYTVGDYNASCQNWGLSVSEDGILYSANNSGLLTFDGNSWNIYELPERSVPTRVFASEGGIYTSSSSTRGYWTKNEDGNLVYETLSQLPTGLNKPRITESLPFIFPHHKITAIARISSYYFIGTAAKGLFLTDTTGNTLLHLTAKNLLQDNQIHDLVVQKDKRLWIAMDNGLALLTLDPPIKLLGERSLTGKPEQAVLRDGNLYLKSNLGSFKHTLAPDDSFTLLPDEEAKSVFLSVNERDRLKLSDLFDNPDALGDFSGTDRIYPVSDKYYWLVNKNEAGLFYVENREPQLKCRILFDNYNLNLVNRGKSFISLNDTLHVVSTMQGVLLVNSRQILEEGLKTQVYPYITGIEYTDSEGRHPVAVEQTSLSLPHDFKELTLHAGTSVFTLNQQISYRIEGVSPEWSPWQKSGQIKLLQLPPGKYKVGVRSYTVRGPFPEIELGLEVRYPWYNTWWANLLYIFLTFLIIGGGAYLFIANLRKKEAEQLREERRAEQERLRQLKNELLEQELQSKNDELVRQASALVRRNDLTQSLLDKLDQQKKALGDAYPDSMYKKLRSVVEKNLNDKEDWNAFETYFDSAHRDFTERLRLQFPDITPGDLKTCCLLRMNLTTKEIASLLNTSVRAVELRRYRLRKRMGLEGDINLTDYLMNF